MKKTIKQTFSLLMLCIFLFIFMFGAVGCSSSYNKGYNKLYNFVKKNSTSEIDGIIQYSKRVEDLFFCFTGSDKDSGILVSAVWYDDKANDDSIQFRIEKVGILENNFLSVEILTSKVGSYYYKGTTLISSFNQSSFIIRNQKQAVSRDGYFTAVSASLIPTLDEYLETIVEECMSQLCDFVEIDIGIPTKEFETKKK